MRKRKPDENISAAIRADERCVDLIKSATKVSPRKYVLPNAGRVNLQSEIAKLVYVTTPSNFSVISAGIRGELTPAQKRRQNAANAPEGSQTSKIAGPQKPLSNDTPELAMDIPNHNKPDRYSIVRNTHRRTGQCSWGILDSHPYDHTNPVIFVGDNLRDTLVECERLNAPAVKIRYTKRGQIGFVTNDDVEDDV